MMAFALTALCIAGPARADVTIARGPNSVSTEIIPRNALQEPIFQLNIENPRVFPLSI